MPKRHRRYDLTTTAAAQRSLRGIADWLAFEEERAKQEGRKVPMVNAYMGLIDAALKKIREKPVAPPSKSANEYRAGLRMYHLRWAKKSPKGHHYVFYEVVPPDKVVVHDVLHEASDLYRHLEKSLPKEEA